MQVTTENENVTHAVIGGKETIDFGISSSAEFFQILSSSLYSNQRLAVIREVLCNAWDAHKDSNRRDIPIQITITDRKLTIRDYGNGISTDMIGPIYGVYGGSTKKNDGNQTGGFGLGCKAPFAYTDHFEVISYHADQYTIYSMSKSSAEVMGKPGITPIASFPTKETGLSVSIPIKSHEDYRKFIEYINTVVLYGEMNVELNGEVLPVIAFSQCTNGFLITEANGISVRYGDVMYPVGKSELTELATNKLTKHLQHLAAGSGIILLAPPHSIAVTPSRETLSMQAHTCNTINKLCADAIATIDARLVKCLPAMEAKSVQNAINANCLNTLLSTKFTGHRVSAAFYYNLDDVCWNRYLAVGKIPVAMHRTQLEHAVSVGLLSKKLVHSYKSFKRKNKTDRDWLVTKLMGPLYSELQQHSLLDKSNLFVRDEDAPSSRHRSSYFVNAIIEDKFEAKFHLRYLTGVVVVATSIEKANLRVRDTNKFNGPGDKLIAYISPKNKAHIAAAIAFFKARGFAVIDATVRAAWEPMPIRRTKPVAVSPTDSLPTLLSQLCKGNVCIDHAKGLANRTSTPEYITKVTGKGPFNFDGLSAHESEFLLNIIGSKGAVCKTEKQLITWGKKGILGANDYVLKHVYDVFTTDVDVQNYLAQIRAYEPSSCEWQARCITGSAVFNRALGTTEPTKEARFYYTLYARLHKHYSYNKPAMLENIHKHVNTIKPDPILVTLLNKLGDRGMASVIDFGKLASLAISPVQAIADKALALFNEIITK